jgi:HSP20 family protein
VSSIYPGVFQLTESREEGLLKMSGGKAFKPPVKIIEFFDYYEIEMPAPGFKNDDFFIKTCGCTLSILAKKAMPAKINEAKKHDSSFCHDLLNTKVDLPADADTDFGTAEYKNGILNIYLYKSGCPVSNRSNVIIVY